MCYDRFVIKFWSTGYFLHKLLQDFVLTTAQFTYMCCIQVPAKRRTDFYFFCVITIAYSYGQSSQLKCLLDYAFSYSFCLFTFNLLTEYEDFYQVSYFQKGISVHTGTYTLLKREREKSSQHRNRMKAA